MLMRHQRRTYVAALYIITAAFLFSLYRLQGFLSTVTNTDTELFSFENASSSHESWTSNNNNYNYNTQSSSSSSTNSEEQEFVSGFQRAAPPFSNNTEQNQHYPHRIAGLSCKAFKGGPEDDIAREMVYWRDIPYDAEFVSQFHNETTETYLTFKPDYGGFNNVRISMEVAITMAVAMGRTLVLPPAQEFNQMNQGANETLKSKAFDDFYHFLSASHEHQRSGGGFKVISFQEFLEREAMTGHLIDNATGKVTFPPYNRTNWDGLLSSNKTTAKFRLGLELWGWLSRAATALPFQDDCVAAFPATANDASAVGRMGGYLETVLQRDIERFPRADPIQRIRARIASFSGNPVPVNSSPSERLAEILAERSRLCFYTKELQDAKSIHFTGNKTTGHRLLMPFYSFLFFEDWHQDLWIKRFVRDHLRYKDEIQCAAARVVAALRQDARRFGNPDGTFDSMHIRRGDFHAQYPMVQMSAEEIYYNNTRFMLKEGRTVFVATDETDSSFFDPLRPHYNLKFLSDYLHLIEDVNSNYYGMIDQLVASRGETFVGSVLSTFSAFINRMRGYHAEKARLLGHEVGTAGTLNSYYYTPDSWAHFREIMRTYKSIEPPFWARDFPLVWRDIDFDVADKIVS